MKTMLPMAFSTPIRFFSCSLVFALLYLIARARYSKKVLAAQASIIGKEDINLFPVKAIARIAKMTNNPKARSTLTIGTRPFIASFAALRCCINSFMDGMDITSIIEIEQQIQSWLYISIFEIALEKRVELQ
ncbi:MAG: hypothetical protein Q6373_012845 [Candidatus Sigynarchaeota archaeon]